MNNMKEKGISPLIAASVLIVLVIGIGFIVSTFLTNLTEEKTIKVEQKGEKSVACGGAQLFIDKDSISVTPNSGSYQFNNCNRKKKLTFNNTFSVEDLENFTVLVKLNSSRIDYSLTGEDDIRFYDEDETTLLSHEIEKWNESGDSFIWVKVPIIENGSNTDHIWMYYNCLDTVNEDPSNTWDSNFVMVHHLEENSGNHSDSTSNNNSAINSSLAIQGGNIGRVDGADKLDGINDFIEINDSDTLDITEKITIEIWIKPTSSSIISDIVRKETSAIGYAIFQYSDDYVYFELWDGGTVWVATPLSINEWNYIVATYDKNEPSNNIKIYKNGSLGENYTWADSIGINDQSLYIGAGGPTESNFNGTIDEVRISNISRSANWTYASYKTMVDDFITYVSEEVSSGESGSIKITVENIGQTKLSNLKIVAYDEYGAHTYNATPSSILRGTKVTITSDGAPQGTVTKIKVYSEDCPGVEAVAEKEDNKWETTG